MGNRVDLTIERLQERRLAGTVRPENAHAFTLADRQIESVENPRRSSPQGRVSNLDQRSVAHQRKRAQDRRRSARVLNSSIALL